MIPMRWLAAVVIVTFPYFVACHSPRGFDTTNPCNTTCMRCLAGCSHKYYFGRVWLSSGAFDEVGISNLKGALTAGMDAYAYVTPCLHMLMCGTPREQMRNITARMTSEFGATLKGVFLDVSSTQTWSKNLSANRQFVEESLTALDAYPFPWFRGLAANEGSWTQILGRTWSPQSPDLKLWFANLNDTKTPSAYKPFGYWPHPDYYQVTMNDGVIRTLCRVVGNGDALRVNGNPTTKNSGFSTVLIAIAGAGAVAIFIVVLSAVLFLLRRRRRLRSEMNQPLLDDESHLSGSVVDYGGEVSAAAVISKEVKSMVAQCTGGTLIIPKSSLADDPLLTSIVERAHVVNKALLEGSLVQRFDTNREGHDGALIVEAVGQSQPWIHFSRVRRPYDEAKHVAPIENRGLRHNSAAYASTLTDALIIVVSDEHAIKGLPAISLFRNGGMSLDISKKDFAAKLRAFIPAVES